MFCPNCGTKNSDTEQKCAQCGFALHKQDVKSKFKGTMVMQGTGVGGRPDAGAVAQGKRPAPGAPTATDAALKGTMIGVAPPDMQAALDAARAQVAARRPASGLGSTAIGGPQTVKGLPMERTPGAASAGVGVSQKAGRDGGMRGTMIGVAPPNMEEALAAAKAAGARPAPRKGPAPLPQGTMIGVAPPDLQAALTAARADAAGALPSEPPPAGQKSPAPQDSAPMPSKLKGTMIGVAPPDMQAVIAAAKEQQSLAQQSLAQQSLAQQSLAQQSLAQQSLAQQSLAQQRRDFGATLLNGTDPVATSPAGGTAGAVTSGARVDAFEGTLLGSSPVGKSSQPTDLALDPTAAMPAIAPPQPQVAHMLGGTVMLDRSPSPQPPVAPEDDGQVPAFGRTVRDDTSPVPGLIVPTGAPAFGSAHPPVQFAQEEEKKAGSPLLLLGVAVVVVGVLLAAVLWMGGRSAEPEVDTASDPAPPTPVNAR